MRSLLAGLFTFGSLMMLLSTSASAIMIAGPEGSINTSPPNPDPGFSNVGRMSSVTGTYVRNGWVLTAGHVGIGPIELDGVTYEPIWGSMHRFTNPGAPDADLVAFKLASRPPLLDLALASSPVRVGDDLILIGNGDSRGAMTTWPTDPPNFDGWFQVPPNVVRWGTNRVDGIDVTAEDALTETRSFYTTFDDLIGPAKDDPEGQAVSGDSGGAVFHRDSGELVGIIFARASLDPAQESQPLTLALYENISVVADLDHYAAQITAVIDQPDCDNGLDDDGDGFMDFPEDSGCEDLLDESEVPEPTLAKGLIAAALGLASSGRKRRA